MVWNADGRHHPGFHGAAFTCAITRDVFQMVPPVVKESLWPGRHYLGGDHQGHHTYGWWGSSALFPGLGRALGETMAVTFVIGNSTRSISLFYPGNSIASSMAMSSPKPPNSSISAPDLPGSGALCHDLPGAGRLPDDAQQDVPGLECGTMSSK